MDKFKEAFIQFSLKHDVLKFGEFKLKSGRISPYFFNAGFFYTGKALQELGQFYAKTLKKNQVEVQHLFGPAYKGLPLATATAIALAELNCDVSVTFNRKEAKDHGEGGHLIGAPLKGKTIIVDDVITAGTAFREAKALIATHGGQLTGIIIALDRCERGLTEISAIEEIKNQGIAVYAIITLFDLLDYLQKTEQTQNRERLLAYQRRYGVGL